MQKSLVFWFSSKKWIWCSNSWYRSSENRNKIDAAAADNSVFSRLHVFSAQCIVGTKRYPELGIFTDCFKKTYFKPLKSLFCVSDAYQKITFSSFIYLKMISMEVRKLINVFLTYALRNTFESLKEKTINLFLVLKLLMLFQFGELGML